MSNTLKIDTTRNKFFGCLILVVIGLPVVAEEAPSFAELSEQMDVPNSQLNKGREYRSCMSSARRSAQDSGVNVDISRACARQAAALEAHLPEDLKAKHASIPSDTDRRIEAQYLALKESRQKDLEDAKRESDFPQGYNAERRTFARLAHCTELARETSRYPEETCAERLNISAAELEAMQTYLRAKHRDNHYGPAR